MRTNKKTRKLNDGELPDDVDWQFIFKVENEDIFRVCPPSNPSMRAKRFEKVAAFDASHADKPELIVKESQKRSQIVEALENCLNKRHGNSLNLGPLNLPPNYHLARLTSIKDGYIELGNTGLMLNIITPLQKFSKGGTTLTDVVRQRFKDLHQFPISSESLAQVEDVFTKKKEDRIKLQQVCLLIEIFTEERLDFRTSYFSEIITNSKSKECGPLQLQDVNPAASCCQSETKIYTLSFFKLVADVRANFVLYDPAAKSVVYGRREVMSQIQQPKNCSVFNQTVLVFKAPKQSYAVIEEIRRQNLELHLAAFRPSDKKMSSNSFQFKYVDHPKEFPCTFCQVLGKQLSPGNPEAFGKKLPLAKPGVPRRVANLKIQPKYVRDNESSEENSNSELASLIQQDVLARKSDNPVLDIAFNGENANIPYPILNDLSSSNLPVIRNQRNSSQSSSPTKAISNHPLHMMMPKLTPKPQVLDQQLQQQQAFKLFEQQQHQRQRIQQQKRFSSETYESVAKDDHQQGPQQQQQRSSSEMYEPVASDERQQWSSSETYESVARDEHQQQQGFPTTNNKNMAFPRGQSNGRFLASMASNLHRQSVRGFPNPFMGPRPPQMQNKQHPLYKSSTHSEGGSYIPAVITPPSMVSASSSSLPMVRCHNFNLMTMKLEQDAILANRPQEEEAEIAEPDEMPLFHRFGNQKPTAKKRGRPPHKQRIVSLEENFERHSQNEKQLRAVRKRKMGRNELELNKDLSKRLTPESTELTIKQEEDLDEDFGETSSPPAAIPPPPSNCDTASNTMPNSRSKVVTLLPRITTKSPRSEFFDEL